MLTDEFKGKIYTKLLSPPNLLEFIKSPFESSYIPLYIRVKNYSEEIVYSLFLHLASARQTKYIKKETEWDISPDTGIIFHNEVSIQKEKEFYTDTDISEKSQFSKNISISEDVKFHSIIWEKYIRNNSKTEIFLSPFLYKNDRVLSHNNKVIFKYINDEYVT